MHSLQSLILFCFLISLVQGYAFGKPIIGQSELIPPQTPGGRSQGNCRPFSSTLSQSDVSRGFSTPFIGVSPENTYEATGDGLEMFLRRPQGTLTRHGHVNNKVGEGATINSTFFLQSGKVTFEVKAPAVAGIVTAVIIISDEHDEIDVELLGGDADHWQTNVYAPSSHDIAPLWGVFGQVDGFPSKSSIVSEYHNYTIDWSATRIIWSVDGHEVRTLKPSQTKINGTEHYPNQASRIQLGIWDASSPEGTSEWAKGPINWEKVSSTISATVKSVRVECD